MSNFQDISFDKFLEFLVSSQVHFQLIAPHRSADKAFTSLVSVCVEHKDPCLCYKRVRLGEFAGEIGWKPASFTIKKSTSDTTKYNLFYYPDQIPKDEDKLIFATIDGGAFVETAVWRLTQTLAPASANFDFSELNPDKSFRLSFNNGELGRKTCWIFPFENCIETDTKDKINFRFILDMDGQKESNKWYILLMRNWFINATEIEQKIPNRREIYLNLVCPRFKTFIDCEKICPPDSQDPKCMEIYKKCINTTECNPGYECRNNLCTLIPPESQNCKADRSCAGFPTNICDVTTGKCTKRCINDAECVNKKCNKVTGHCYIQKDCRIDAECGEQICDPNTKKCIDKPSTKCVNNKTDCNSNYVCVSGTCQDCGFWYYEEDNECHPSLWKIIGIPVSLIFVFVIILLIILIIISSSIRSVSKAL